MITYKVRQATLKVILHDSHTKPDVERVVNVLRWKGRKMGLLDIGYHFVIDRDGSLTETRPMALIGTHCAGHDLDSIGVCLIGGLSDGGSVEDNFTEDQRRSLFDLFQHLKQCYPGIAILGHDEATGGRRRHGLQQDRICPACDMQDLRADYAQYTQSGGLVA